MVYVRQVPDMKFGTSWYYTVYYRPPDGRHYNRKGEVRGLPITCHREALKEYLEHYSLPYAGEAIVFGPDASGTVVARTFEISAPPRSYRLNET